MIEVFAKESNKRKRVRFEEKLEVHILPSEEVPALDGTCPVVDVDPSVAANHRARWRCGSLLPLSEVDFLDDVLAAEEDYEEPEELINDMGIPIEPFHLRHEREEGYFDAHGNYIEHRFKRVRDAWLESLDDEEDQPSSSTTRSAKLRRRLPSDASINQGAPPVSPAERADVRSKLTALLEPGERTVDALLRLGRHRKEDVHKASTSAAEPSPLKAEARRNGGAGGGPVSRGERETEGSRACQSNVNGSSRIGMNEPEDARVNVSRRQMQRRAAGLGPREVPMDENCSAVFDKVVEYADLLLSWGDFDVYYTPRERLTAAQAARPAVQPLTRPTLPIPQTASTTVDVSDDMFAEEDQSTAGPAPAPTPLEQNREDGAGAAIGSSPSRLPDLNDVTAAVAASTARHTPSSDVNMGVPMIVDAATSRVPGPPSLTKDAQILGAAGGSCTLVPSIDMTDAADVVESNELGSLPSVHVSRTVSVAASNTVITSSSSGPSDLSGIAASNLISLSSGPNGLEDAGVSASNTGAPTQLQQENISMEASNLVTAQSALQRVEEATNSAAATLCPQRVEASAYATGVLGMEQPPPQQQQQHPFSIGASQNCAHSSDPEIPASSNGSSAACERNGRGALNPSGSASLYVTACSRVPSVSRAADESQEGVGCGEARMAEKGSSSSAAHEELSGSGADKASDLLQGFVSDPDSQYLFNSEYGYYFDPATGYFGDAGTGVWYAYVDGQYQVAS